MAFVGKKPVLVPIVGLDTSAGARYIDDRASPDCQNVRIDRAEIKKREGTLAIGAASTGMVQKIIEHQREASRFLARITTDKFEYFNQQTQAWVDYTGATALNGTEDVPVTATIAKISNKNVLVFSNFVDNIKKWVNPTGGNIADLGGTPPIPKYMLYFNGYLLLGYIKDGANIYAERIQWSDFDDPETWSGGLSGFQDCFDGTKMTGLARLKDVVVVSKEGSLWNGWLTGDDRVMQFEMSEPRMGFISGNTIQSIPGNQLIGLGQDGIIVYNGLRADMAAPGILDDIREDLNPQVVERSHGVIVTELDEYWLFIPVSSGNYPTRLYRLNYRTGNVYRDTVRNITASGLLTQIEKLLVNDMTGTINSYTGIFNSIIRNSLYPRLVMGDSYGYCYQFDYNRKDENGTAIEAYWCSKDYVAKEGHYASWQGIEYIASGDYIEWHYSTDGGTTWTEIGTQTLTSTQTKYFMPFHALGETIRVRCRNNESNSSFAIKQFTLHAIPRESSIL